MKTKSFVSIILLTVLISSFLVFKANSETTPMIKVSSADIPASEFQIGSELKVNVTIENINGLWQWILSGVVWDPTVLNLTNAQEGPFLASSGAASTLFFTFPPLSSIDQGLLSEVSDVIVDSHPGVQPNANGSGVLAVLTFKILSVKNSTIQLNQTQLNSVNEYNNGTIPITHSKMDGSIRVIQPANNNSTNNTNTESTTIDSTTTDPSTTGSTSPDTSPNTTDSNSTDSTQPASSGSNEPQPELSAVYAIVGAGAVMAVLIAVAVFIRRK